MAALRFTTFRTSAREVDLPPGSHSVETAVLDRHANRVSVGRTDFESARAKTLGLSSVILVQQLQPTTGPPNPADPFQFPANGVRGSRVIPSHPLAYFVVFPNPSNSAKPKVQVEFVSNGTVIAKETSALPMPGANGSIPMVIEAAAHRASAS